MMISSISIIECKSTSEYRSENKFEFGIKIVVKFVFEIVIKLNYCFFLKTQALTNV